ncbi:MAG TPA: hypothetical protein DIU07_05390 [Rhodobacteraceae bacterium]|nr:hypothetical protein [Paracoccaceae bacterium]
MFGPRSRTGLALLGAALFGGPILAGLAQHDWSVLPVLAALFLLYIAAARRPDLATGAGRASLAMMAFVQSANVVIGWAIGLLLADILGPVALPLWAPLAITALGAGVGAWAFRDAAEMDVMLDSALARIAEMETMTPPSRSFDVPWPSPVPEADDALRRALRALRARPGIDVAHVDRIVHRLHAEAGAAGFDPLYDAAGLDGSLNEPAVDLALLRFSALPQVFDQLISRGEAGLAPMLLLNAPNPLVRAEARALVSGMIDAAVPVTELPDPALLRELAGAFPGEGYNRLLARCAHGGPARIEA